MRIGVISDSHDHLPNLRFALARLAEQKIEIIFHCGDLISPFVTRELGKFPGAVHTVFGNNDADRFLAQKIAGKDAPNVTHHGEFGFVDCGGHRIGFTHYMEYARGFAASGQCDAAFFGHTHVHYSERANGRLVLNPGELLGLMGKPGFCVYDTQSREFERVEFPHEPW
ncbi:metallophosphoesterase [Candidatus Sumerlaeota bacterium]|nr:metallophosphoesterase [Candidatus Sumerlaeota bacterium]